MIPTFNSTFALPFGNNGLTILNHRTFNKFTRFFDKLGNDMNLSVETTALTSLYDGTTVIQESFIGKIFFPKISIGLIESQQLFLLQEVTGPAQNFQLRKIKGTAVLIGGNSTISGIDSDFSTLQIGNTIKIIDDDYTVTSLGGTSSFSVSPTPSSSVETQDIYLYDYISLNELRSTPGSTGKLTISLESQEEFFLYSVNYSEDIPIIEKHYSADYQIVDGSSDAVDPLTGRVIIPDVTTIPTQINIGFSSGATATYDEIYESNLVIYSDQSGYETLLGSTANPLLPGSTYVTIAGTNHDFYNNTTFSLVGITAGGNNPFYESSIEVIEVGVSGTDTYVIFSSLIHPNYLNNYSISDFRLVWNNSNVLANISLYAETESEDERFKLVLENFGKKIDLENEYIFRESDIHEDLPDYDLLNKKRKELLIEGDNIYPYMGSYKALINIINFFGYYDLRIKEYFLNVDANSANYKKYMHVLVPKDETQRAQVREAWELLPSSIYKKTSLFGLFYDINRATPETDIYGIPLVEDAFDFSPEEVLIKLFGLKELLKKQFLPLNARIYDITGEGIYFERIRIDTWSDSLNHLVVNLGRTPQYSIYPNEYTHLTDIRRIDRFYIEKFTEQGLTGFSDQITDNPYLTAAFEQEQNNYINNYADDYFIGDPLLQGSYDLYSYANYLQNPYVNNFDYTLPVVDEIWNFMPPGIANPNFNNIAARLFPLPDDENILSGGPALLESLFSITWEESDFSWKDLGIMGPNGSPININHWSWESIGRGEFIDMRWTVEKPGPDGFFYDSGRHSIDDFKIEAIGATVFSIPASMSVTISGGSVIDVQITNPGFGYTSIPDIVVYPPGGGGTAATITPVITGGYVSSVTFTGGSGYSFTPYVTVDPPVPQYEITNRYLHAIALPYTGFYEVALYLYDITNGFSVNFQQYEVRSWNVDFVSIHRKETPERSWADFDIPIPSTPETFNLPPRKVNWSEITGPWYYPMHTKSNWEDAKTSWESLNFSSYKGDSLFEYSLDTEIISIDRDNNTVTVLNDLTSDLNNGSVLNVGDYLFFTRNESEHIKDNLFIPQYCFSKMILGNDGINADVIAAVSGITGSNILTTTIDTSGYVTPGDQVYIEGYWYTLVTADATTITLDTSLINAANSVFLPVYTQDLDIPLYISEDFDLGYFSRVLISDVYNIDSINPLTDFYIIANGTSQHIISSIHDETAIKSAIIRNQTHNLYMTWGLFAGTSAIEITNIKVLNQYLPGYGGSVPCTIFKLNDPNKELFAIDSNFSLRLADYDVDYAENRIGPGSLTYQNLDEVSWNENDTLTWFGSEYHGGSLCGFVIPFVSPGGTITIDENPSFAFSGNIDINSTSTGLINATNELNSSDNYGIKNFNYATLPETDLFITNSSGNRLDNSSDVLYGQDWIQLTGLPNYSIKIPAEIGASVSGGSIVNIGINNTGWGYTTVPSVKVAPPGGTGHQAIITVNMTGLPYHGRIDSFNIIDPGSGYTSSPAISIDVPTDYKPFDNYIWTGYEWIQVNTIDPLNNMLMLNDGVTTPLPNKARLRLPYEYHKQLFRNKNFFQQFYHFIHAEAIDPSNSMLSYVNLDNGVESEWLDYPNRTYSYPLRNSFYFLSTQGLDVLEQDYLYKKWEYEGSDYPPLTIQDVYMSDVLSYESRIPFSQTTQSAYSYIDTVISDHQQRVPIFTPVVFSYDKCRIPGKTNPIWTITNDVMGKIEAMSSERKLMWNFTRPGNYTISLKLQDANGNISSGQKNSFIVV
jgi:hypothetical protein